MARHMLGPPGRRRGGPSNVERLPAEHVGVALAWQAKDYMRWTTQPGGIDLDAQPVHQGMLLEGLKKSGEIARVVLDADFFKILGQPDFSVENVAKEYAELSESDRQAFEAKCRCRRGPAFGLHALVTARSLLAFHRPEVTGYPGAVLMTLPPGLKFPTLEWSVTAEIM